MMEQRGKSLLIKNSQRALMKVECNQAGRNAFRAVDIYTSRCPLDKSRENSATRYEKREMGDANKITVYFACQEH